jgi:hypothetical protein
MTLTRAQRLSDIIESLAQLSELYERHATELRAIHRGRGTAIAGAARAGRDDIQAEINYLRLRQGRPDVVLLLEKPRDVAVEWLRRALCVNGTGTLRTASYRDIDLRYRSHVGDLTIDYLVVEARHAGTTRRWLTGVLPRLAPGTPISVTGVFGRARMMPGSASVVVLRWLRRHRVGYYTAAAAVQPAGFAAVLRLRAELGLPAPACSAHRDPMIFFTSPGRLT